MTPFRRRRLLPMSPRLLHFVVFVEGFCSLGAEVIALRRLVPHVGSAIVVTAPTIGAFLLALAWGYHSGGRVTTGYPGVVARNFLLAAGLIGAGLTAGTVETLFRGAPPLAAYLLFVATLLCPVAWLLGQTVPILANLVPAAHRGEAAGQALFWSTLGSFLGALALSLGLMAWFGVWSAVLAASLLLLIAAALVQPPTRTLAAGLLVVGLGSVVLNLAEQPRQDTAYADYAVAAVEREGMTEPRVFRVNGQHASLLDHSEPPRYARYIERMRRLLWSDFALRERDILVLGAGGFTLSHREPAEYRNRYTYVDIDPAIRGIAERDFLGEPVNGEVVTADARRYLVDLRAGDRRFDAIVADVYTSQNAIPGHLVTQEFWRDARRALKPDGLLLANLILDGRLATPYARNLLATVQSVFGPCAVEVLDRGAAASNVVVSCVALRPSAGPVIYVDERHAADLDAARRRPAP